MNDLKQYLKLSDEAIVKSLENNNYLKALSHISTDMMYWKKMFTYSEDRSALENFLFYRTASSFHLYEQGADDADLTPFAVEGLRSKLDQIATVKSIEIGKEIDAKEKHRAFKVVLTKDKTVYLESDTANSLMGDLGAFLRILLEKKHGKNWPNETYIREFNLPEDKPSSYYTPFRNFYFSCLVSTILDSNKDSEIVNCLEILEHRARITHTSNNLILVPYGYNVARGVRLSTYISEKKINDRLDLTLVDFKEMLSDSKFNDEALHCRLENDKCTIESIQFLMDYQDILFPKIPIFSDEILGDSVLSITKRSELIVSTFSEEVSINKLELSPDIVDNNLLKLKIKVKETLSNALKTKNGRRVLTFLFATTIFGIISIYLQSKMLEGNYNAPIKELIKEYGFFVVMKHHIAEIDFFGSFISGFILTGLLYIGFYFIKKKLSPCPECDRILALKKISTIQTHHEDISIKVELKERDNYGSVVKTKEQYIPGKKMYYENKHKCKHCGYERMTYHSIKEANT